MSGTVRLGVAFAGGVAPQPACAARRFTHEQATSAIVVSYYWHFVDVVWIGLFCTIYLLK